MTLPECEKLHEATAQDKAETQASQERGILTAQDKAETQASQKKGEY